ncbi:MAG: hypothetical protein ABIR28_14165 [Vicinamibacteria bacterium]
MRDIQPDVTFSDRLALQLGECEVQVLNHGRAVTPGDAFLYLPKEKVVVMGDLIVNPIPSLSRAIPPSGSAFSNGLTGWKLGSGSPDTMNRSTTKH